MLPSNLNVSLDFVSGNIEILGKQNSLFPSGPVIKCLMLEVNSLCETYQIWLFFRFYENFLELFKVEVSLFQLENTKEGVFESKFEVLYV